MAAAKVVICVDVVSQDSCGECLRRCGTRTAMWNVTADEATQGRGGTGPPPQAMSSVNVVARMAVENVTADETPGEDGSRGRYCGRGREIDIEDITPVGVAV